ncbi:enoyl-CoA hydratase/isomerase family protein [Agromyces larvae]|uniref:3-hydroxyisobutyryl-CoA hydrolase n=1 Tax=Agromyces larvae TaxID=2929802 RepID=A0ABY4C4A9_9MICO|nr:enoyl-CoA hydratase/isomerase family protein [Agromyces larvae]UOE45001.1 enoyl-CoA hydratase/isomerase family protein [Agromyces larvae]
MTVSVVQVHSPVSAVVVGRLGHLSLNRPDSINAIDLEMMHAMTETLDAWATDDAVDAVLLDGVGDYGFCAGGDFREILARAAEGMTIGTVFFRDEYRLIAKLAEYPKPVVSIMHGMTMGGGISLAGHASVRVVTDQVRLGQPETGYGFVPDGGATWRLARTPGEIGTYLALNSIDLTAADAVALGFADVIVPSERIGELTAALGDAASPEETVRRFATEAGPSPVLARRDWIDACYSADTVRDILERLWAFANGDEVEGLRAPDSADPDAAANAADAADTLLRLSPTALVATLRSVRAARDGESLRDALERELRLARWFTTQPDLFTGVQALVAQNTDSLHQASVPDWKPADLDDVDLIDIVAAMEMPLRHSVFPRGLGIPEEGADAE